MKKKWIIISVIFSIILIGSAFIGVIMSNVEQPKYDIIASDKNIEIRKYNSMILAEVTVEGTRKEAIKKGFRILADYIFGNNIVKQEITMTAPVTQQKNKKIAMTAPVQQQGNDNLWNISFIMPSQYKMDDLPQPNNKQINLKVVPKKQYVAIRFAGMNSENNIRKNEEQLLSYIKNNKLLVTGIPKYAFYNPPWTLPFIRRNEILIELIK